MIFLVYNQSIKRKGAENMLYLQENLKKYRLAKNLTQEDLANFLNITPQSVSKWERGETYPDITLLPALANIFDTSIDLLIGMDRVRSERARLMIHEKATGYMRQNQLDMAEKVYRDALLIYPNKPGMMLGLAMVLALSGNTAESTALIERALPLSDNEKQKATARAALCLLYARGGNKEKAADLASKLPHKRECREEILTVVKSESSDDVLDAAIRTIILGEVG